MMKKILMTAMKTSISEVLETMFYLPVEFKEESTRGEMDKAETDKACQLKFRGDCSGSVTLIVPLELLSEMTGNFTGEPGENCREEDLLGTLTEALNMVCGNALSKTDSKKPFELDIPRVIDAAGIPESLQFAIMETINSTLAINVALD